MCWIDAEISGAPIQTEQGVKTKKEICWFFSWVIVSNPAAWPVKKLGHTCPWKNDWKLSSRNESRNLFLGKKWCAPFAFWFQISNFKRKLSFQLTSLFFIFFAIVHMDSTEKRIFFLWQLFTWIQLRNAKQSDPCFDRCSCIEIYLNGNVDIERTVLRWNPDPRLTPWCLTWSGLLRQGPL